MSYRRRLYLLLLSPRFSNWYASAPGFSNELRDDAGIGRLWTLMSRYLLICPPNSENKKSATELHPNCGSKMCHLHLLFHRLRPELNSFFRSYHTVVALAEDWCTLESWYFMLCTVRTCPVDRSARF